MKKLTKPKKYIEQNAEFYANEVKPISSTSTSNNQYLNQNAGGSGAGANTQNTQKTNQNKNNSPSFADILMGLLGKK